MCAVAFYSKEAAAQKKQLEKTSKGIIVYPLESNSKAIWLQVVSPTIIHITISPIEEIKKDTTLMVIGQPKFAAWSVNNNGKECIVSTASVKAFVSLHSGEIRFTDAKGKTILNEEQNGSSFIPVTIESGNSWAVQQSFIAKADEAFYGLGQHQQGFVNYKGQEVELLQNNTEVAIPFLVSNKNYGILWDNYSITSFGDGRKYEPLNKLQLFDEKGSPGGLTASYSLKNDSKKITERTEPIISYDYLPSLKKFPPAFSLNDGKVTWQGFIQSSFSGVHKFSVRYGGYLKLWLNEKLVLDRWRQCWNPATAIVSLPLVKGKKNSFKLEWIPDGAESFISCNWMRPATAVNNDHFLLRSEAADNINYYFVYGKNVDEIISGYRQLTGKAPIVPKWALGFWQSRERYKTQEEIISTVKEFRRRSIPLDNIVLDWQYWKPDEWGSQQFDATRFPDAKGMIDSLHHLYHTHLMISVWPKFYKGTKNYNLMNEKGWLLTKNIEDNSKDWLGYVSTFYDAFNPAAGKFFWQLIKKNLYTKGVDAWWMDASEPDIQSNLSIEQRKQLMYPNAVGSAIKYFNAYPLVNAKPIYEGQRSEDPNKRVFILTRSAYAGSQRYAAAVWSGDIAARWHDMKNQVAAGVNFSLSGIPYWTMDIGGFAVERHFENANKKDAEEWKEQMTRWYQFGAFCPLFRVHGQYPYREIFNTAQENDSAYQSMLFYDKLRYRLMPYIYSVAAKTYFDDYTIMRGLVMDFANDKNVLAINDQYLFGPSLLVNPVYNYRQRNKKLYLPDANGWYDLYTGRFFKGGQIINAGAPYNRIPVFVKEGSIIPFGPALQYTLQKPADTIHLFVYTGKDASFNLYEDEDTNYNYEKGKVSLIPLRYNEKTKTVTIEDRKGSFTGMLAKRVFTITWVERKKTGSLDFVHYQSSVTYEGKKITIKK